MVFDFFLGVISNTDQHHIWPPNFPEAPRMQISHIDEVRLQLEIFAD